VDDASVATPTVVDELQRGYTLNGKLLRPALVRVAMPAEKWDKRN
jgi:molecular chaperone GrpE (heat shock protein)